MYKKKIEIIQFQKDDYVITPMGYGIVTEDQEEISDTEELSVAEVMVQHKEGSGGNPGNTPLAIDYLSVYITSEENYKNSK